MENLLIHALKKVGICPAGFVVINKVKIPTSYVANVNINNRIDLWVNQLYITMIVILMPIKIT